MITWLGGGAWHVCEKKHFCLRVPGRDLHWATA